MVFIREEKVNTINCQFGKRNHETAVALSPSNNDQARPYYGEPEKLSRTLAEEQTARYRRHFSGLDTGPGLTKDASVPPRGTALEMESSSGTS
jgi:hypothetical protein